MTSLPAFSGITPHRAQIEHARVMLLFPQGPQVAGRVFLALWNAKGKPVEAQALLATMPERNCKRVASEIWRQVESLHSHAVARGWPIAFSAQGSAFRLERLDARWNWRALVPDTAALARLAFPDAEPNTARVLGSLMSHFGGPITTDKIGVAVERMCGRRPCRLAISTHVQKARKLLRASGSTLEIRAARGVGYELRDPASTPPLADRFQFAMRHGELSAERIGAACEFLQTPHHTAALVFLILWDRRDELIAHESISARWEEYMGEVHTQMALTSSIRAIKRALRLHDLGFSIRAHTSIGYQLVTTSERFRFDRKSLRDQVRTTPFERVAQLATLLPNSTCGTLCLLQILRDRPGRAVSWHEIASAYSTMRGSDLERGSIMTGVDQARRDLRAAGSPVTIVWEHFEEGYRLKGDLEGWLAGEEPALQPLLPKTRSRLPRLAISALEISYSLGFARRRPRTKHAAARMS